MGLFPLRLFPKARKASFLERRGRFLVEARLGRRTVRAYLPNPGRLGELLLPGSELHLVREGGENRKTEYTAVAVAGPDGPVLLHTGRTNDIARALILENRVPGLEGAVIVKGEVPFARGIREDSSREAAEGRRRGPAGPGSQQDLHESSGRIRSRFDFLLEHDGEPFWLEVKSCTLLAGRAALFPDAVTERGKRHLEELDEMARRGIRAGILFVVHHPRARWFLPDWHTDPAFARAFLEAGPALRIWPLPVRTGPDLEIRPAGPPLPIPREILAREIEDRGVYLVLLELGRRKSFSVGSLGRVDFPAGFYVYVGSARKGLTARIARHRRTRKRLHWHVDHLREKARFLDAFPIRSSLAEECALADALAALGEPFPEGFGSSDCSCPTHLFRFGEDPRRMRAFQDLLARFRTLALEESGP